MGSHKGGKWHQKPPRPPETFPKPAQAAVQQQLTGTRQQSYANALNAPTVTTATNFEKEEYQTSAKQSQEKRNTLIVQGPKDPNGKPLMPRPDWIILIFEDFQVGLDDVIGVDWHAGGSHLVELELKEDVDLAKFAGLSKEKHGKKFVLHEPARASTQVTFRGVPLSLSNQELLHLIRAYGGKVEGEIVIEKEPLTVNNTTIMVNSTTRTVQVTFQGNKRLRNYYWFQGPREGDQLRRVSVSYSGHPGRQCAWCLRYPADLHNPCESNAKTAICKVARKRTTLADYFSVLRKEDQYMSLKQQYMWNEKDSDMTENMFDDTDCDEGDEGGSTIMNIPTIRGPHLKHDGMSNWAESEDERDQVDTQVDGRSNPGAPRRQPVKTMKLVSEQIAEVIDNEEEFAKQVDCLASLVAKSYNPRGLKLKEDGESLQLPPRWPPWDTSKLLSKIGASQSTLSDTASHTASLNYTLLESKTIHLLLERKLKFGGPVPKSRSQSRGRSEGDDDTDELAAKKTKESDPDHVEPPEAAQADGTTNNKNGSVE